MSATRDQKHLVLDLAKHHWREKRTWTSNDPVKAREEHAAIDAVAEEVGGVIVQPDVLQHLLRLARRGIRPGPASAVQTTYSVIRKLEKEVGGG